MHAVDEGGRSPAFDFLQPTPSSAEAQRFEELYRATYRPLVRLCRRAAGASCDPEALAQEAFIRAWRSWDRYAADQPFWPWVATIARRLSFTLAVTNARREALFPRVLGTVDMHPSPEDAADGVSRRVTVRDALSRLSERDRRLLFLRDVEGWSCDELARFEGVTSDSIRGRLKRARATFRHVYDQRSGAALGAIVLRFRHRLEHWAAAVQGRLSDSGVVAAALMAGLLLPVTSPAAPVRPHRAATDLPSSSAAASPPFASSTASTTDGDGNGQPTPLPQAAAAETMAVEPAVDPTVGSSYSFTPSPSYDEDHTVYATGMPAGCRDTAPGCRALLRSTDGGSTWHRLPARGWDGGSVLLPPTYPADPRIFSYSAASVSVSENGGESFRILAPFGRAVVGPPTMSPNFSTGDPRILFGSAQPYVASSAVAYRDDLRTVEPLVSGLPPDIVPSSFSFSPAYAEDRTLLVSAVRVPLSGLLLSSATLFGTGVFRCVGDQCEHILDTGQGGVSPTLVWSSGAEPTAFARSAFGLYRSTDRGRSFSPIALPDKGFRVDSIVAGTGGRVYALATAPLDGRVESALYASDDNGDSWATVHEAYTWLSGLSLLPDGALLVSDGAGIACSVDGARSWGPRCRRSGV